MSVKAMLPALDTHTHILSLLPPLPHLSLLLARARALSLSRALSLARVCVCARALSCRWTHMLLSKTYTYGTIHTYTYGTIHLMQVDTHAPIQDGGAEDNKTGSAD